MNKKKNTEVSVTFSLTLPTCSKKNARKLMDELTGSLMDFTDNADCLMDSFEETFGDDDTGYCFGFGKKMKIDN